LNTTTQKIGIPSGMPIFHYLSVFLLLNPKSPANAASSVMIPAQMLIELDC